MGLSSGFKEITETSTECNALMKQGIDLTTESIRTV